jgi:hypothetical protein
MDTDARCRRGAPRVPSWIARAIRSSGQRGAGESEVVDAKTNSVAVVAVVAVVAEDAKNIVAVQIEAW